MPCRHVCVCAAAPAASRRTRRRSARRRRRLLSAVARAAHVVSHVQLLVAILTASCATSLLQGCATAALLSRCLLRTLLLRSALLPSRHLLIVRVRLVSLRAWQAAVPSAAVLLLAFGTPRWVAAALAVHGTSAHEPLPSEYAPRRQPLHLSPLAQCLGADPSPLRKRAVLTTLPALIESGGTRWQAIRCFAPRAHAQAEPSTVCCALISPRHLALRRLTPLTAHILTCTTHCDCERRERAGELLSRLLDLLHARPTDRRPIHIRQVTSHDRVVRLPCLRRGARAHWRGEIHQRAPEALV